MPAVSPQRKRTTPAASPDASRSAIEFARASVRALVPPAGPSNQDDVELIDDSDYDSQATIPAITENNEDNPGSGNEGGPAQTSS